MATVLTPGLSITLALALTVAGPAGGPGGHSAGGRSRTAATPPVAWRPPPGPGGGRTECRDGKAGAYNCHNVDLLAVMPIGQFAEGPSFALNDLWGWTDSTSGREFVLLGSTQGTAFVEITDPQHPRYLGQLPLPAGAHPSIWRDIKTYKHYAFIVSDAIAIASLIPGLNDGDTRNGPHGLQIFDLNRLLVPSPSPGPTVFTETAHYDGFDRAHNLVIDTATGFAYAVGVGQTFNTPTGETCGGGLYVMDIHAPLQPAFRGCYTERATGRLGTGYIHDAQCTIYHGPDQAYQGHEICLNAAETAISIADVTDKQHPQTLSIARYPTVGYAHQGWLSEDQRYFFLGDEQDEPNTHTNTRTLVFDLKTLSDPVLAKEFFGTTPATDHNMYVRGRYLYQSNYMAGLRILDISDPVHPQEVGYFQTTQGAIDVTGSGSWSNYPYFKSGTIAVSSMGEGLFLLRSRLPGAP